MSAFGVRVLSVPALLAVCLCSFPVLLLAELASLPDPTGSRLCARPVVPGLLRFPESCAPPSFPLPVVRFRPALLLRFSLYAPALIRSAVMVFHSSPLSVVENDRTAAPSSGQPSQCPGMRSLCCRCSSMSLAISWQYKSR